jgi:hypothetical protein
MGQMRGEAMEREIIKYQGTYIRTERALWLAHTVWRPGLHGGLVRVLMLPGSEGERRRI